MCLLCHSLASPSLFLLHLCCLSNSSHSHLDLPPSLILFIPVISMPSTFLEYLCYLFRVPLALLCPSLLPDFRSTISEFPNCRFANLPFPSFRSTGFPIYLLLFRSPGFPRCWIPALPVFRISGLLFRSLGFLSFLSTPLLKIAPSYVLADNGLSLVTVTCIRLCTSLLSCCIGAVKPSDLYKRTRLWGGDSPVT